jgi:hypothetical protein
MILGKNACFVTPSDSVAVIAANSEHIPYLKRDGIKVRVVCSRVYETGTTILPSVCLCGLCDTLIQI